MTDSELTNTAPAPAAPGPRARARSFGSALSAVDRWLEQHDWLPVLILAAGGLLARVLIAVPAMLNPDEAMHVIRSSEPTMLAFYREDLAGPDPSFLHVILFPLCKWLVSDFVLRLPSILSGMVVALVGYKWLKELFDKTTALIGLVLLLYAPAIVYVSTEVRAYALMMAFATCALFFLEAGLRRRSARFLLLFGVAQCFALISQYSALFVVAAAGIYSLYVVIRDRLKGRPLLAWLGAEALTAGLMVFLYVTHLSKLHGGSAEESARTGFLSRAYFNQATEKMLGFVVSRTVAAFGFLFTSRPVGIIGLVLFLAGIVLLAVWGFRQPDGRNRRAAWFLALAPWLMAAAGGVLCLYPFAGTRHIILLMLFAVPPIALALRRIVGNRPTIVLLAALVIVPWWNITRHNQAAGWRVDPYDARRSHVLAAVDYVRSQAPAGGIILSDLESGYVFRHYLFGGHTGTWRDAPSGFYEHEWNGYRMITFTYWKVSAESLGNAFQYMVESYGFEPGIPVFVVSCGWSASLSKYLHKQGIDYPDTREYGHRTSVTTIPVGTQKMTDDLAARVQRTERTLNSLAYGLSRTAKNRFRTVLWPSCYLDNTVEELTRGLAPQTISYQTMYSLLMTKRMVIGDLLPAVAFWSVGTRERHLQLMDFMNQGQNYVAAGNRFTLLAISPDTLAAVYVIEPDEPGSAAAQTE